MLNVSLIIFAFFKDIQYPLEHYLQFSECFQKIIRKYGEVPVSGALDSVCMIHLDIIIEYKKVYSQQVYGQSDGLW